jgi:hypothetical protein
VIADETGLEMMLNGRMVQVPFVVSHLILSGRFPLERWQEDVRRPQVRCLAMQSDLLERPQGAVDVAQDLFTPAMRATLRDRFELVGDSGGIWLYASRR